MYVAAKLLVLLHVFLRAVMDYLSSEVMPNASSDCQLANWPIELLSLLDVFRHVVLHT